MLANVLADLLDQRAQFGLLKSIELPVSKVLYGMEHAGAQVDMIRLTEMRDQFAADARQAQEIAWESAGERVNLQSPKQLQKILFEDMGLKPTKKTKSGSYTTNAAALQTLYEHSLDNDRANQFLGALLSRRSPRRADSVPWIRICRTFPIAMRQAGRFARHSCRGRDTSRCSAPTTRRWSYVSWPIFPATRR